MKSTSDTPVVEGSTATEESQSQVEPRVKTVGIYVPSYNRYDDIRTWNVLNDCTYVVRESERDAYEAAGVTKLLSVPDDETDSLPKVRQWIIDNTPEDIVVQVDDDIISFYYVNGEHAMVINDPDVVDMEIERVAQLLSDLNLGFAATQMTVDVRKYNREFSFRSTIGIVCWYNKDGLKGRYDDGIRFKADIDFELQELLLNRIMLVPEYLRVRSEYDSNKGGNSVDKSSKTMQEAVEYMSNKWGKYYRHDFKRNISQIKVPR